MACCDISDRDGILLLLLGITDAECDAVFFFLGVCGLVAGRGVDRLKILAYQVAEVCDSVLRIADKLALGLSSMELFSFYV